MGFSQTFSRGIVREFLSRLPTRLVLPPSSNVEGELVEPARWEIIDWGFTKIE